MPDRIGQWRAENQSRRLVHLIPVDDLQAHTHSNCACRPDLDFYPVLGGVGDERNFGVAVHHAWDHREDNLNGPRN